MTLRQSLTSTDFKPRPQVRKVGSGAGRQCFPWKAKYPWLVIAAERVYVLFSGGEGALLQNRGWVQQWTLSPCRLRQEVEALFPGISSHLDAAWRGKTPWEKNLHNRVYKMYYYGTSARGKSHDPATRASISPEHWRNWPSRTTWEGLIINAVGRAQVNANWMEWLQ